MLAPKKGESTSFSRCSHVIYMFSVVISIILLNACIQCGAAAEAEPNFAPKHIEESCIEKCPDQVSVRTVTTMEKMVFDKNNNKKLDHKQMRVRKYVLIV